MQHKPWMSACALQKGDEGRTLQKGDEGRTLQKGVEGRTLQKGDEGKTLQKVDDGKRKKDIQSHKYIECHSSEKCTYANKEVKASVRRYKRKYSENLAELGRRDCIQKEHE